jgi:hypothetical protein
MTSDKTPTDFAQKASQFKKFSDSLTKMVRLYQNLSHDRTTNYFKMLNALNKIEAAYTQTENNLVSLKFGQWLSEEKSRLDEVKGALVYDFGRLLAEHLSKVGFRLEGNFPEFRVKMLLLDANVQNAKCQLWYGYKEEFLNSTPFDPVSAQKAIVYAYNRVAKHDFDSSRFIERLYKAYETVARKQQKQIGDDVGIISTLVELNFQRQDQKFLANPRKNTFQEYPREFFSYDLFRLKQREINNLTLSLGIASREQNRSRESYLWIPSDESLQGNVYSLLSFRRIK